MNKVVFFFGLIALVSQSASAGPYAVKVKNSTSEDLVFSLNESEKVTIYAGQGREVQLSFSQFKKQFDEKYTNFHMENGPESTYVICDKNFSADHNHFENLYYYN